MCGSADTPETGIQGDVPGTGGANCGLTLSERAPRRRGAVQGAGHCAYVRLAGAYSGGVMKAFSLADPANPVQTDEEPLYGGSESIRTQVANGRAILVSGRGVYDITNCEELVFKGEIQWPSATSRNGAHIAGTSSHEIAISHDAMRVYSGLGFAIAYLDNLEDPSTWRVYNHTCAIGRQLRLYPLHAGAPGSPTLCDVAPQGDYPPQFSHSSDDNLEGTRWYGANQNGDQVSQLEPSTARIVDISQRGNPRVLDTLAEFPGHSMDWWRSPDGREFIVGANELGAGDTCEPYPRPTSLDERRRRVHRRGHGRRPEACVAGEPDDQRAAELRGQVGVGLERLDQRAVRLQQARRRLGDDGVRRGRAARLRRPRRLRPEGGRVLQ